MCGELPGTQATPPPEVHEDLGRIDEHPILGPRTQRPKITIYLDGEPLEAEEGEPLAAALWANDVRVLRWSEKRGEPRGLFCALGRCTDCVMTVDGRPNVRTCVTPAREEMRVERQGAARCGDE